MSKKKIVFTGGGTVGHVTLNLILMPKFIQDGWDVHYIGDKKGIEYQEIVKSALPVTFHGIATGKLRRYFDWQNVSDIFKVVFGILQSLGIMLKLRPKALFSKGGFVSVPPVIAARLTGVPVYIHESDLSMGLANKIAYKFATTMYTTFDQNKSLSKIKHIGAITKVVNPEQLDMSKVDFLKDYFDKSKKTLLFIGGSGGAKVFNDFISTEKMLLENFNIINISGDSRLNTLQKSLYRVDYVTDLYQPLMNMADIVITRGGSNTLFELLALKKLHLIIPLGKEASRGDQLENAAYFVRKGYSRQLLESDFNLNNLELELAQLLSEEDVYHESMTQSDELTSPEVFYRMLLQEIGY